LSEKGALAKKRLGNTDVNTTAKSIHWSATAFLQSKHRVAQVYNPDSSNYVCWLQPESAFSLPFKFADPCIWNHTWWTEIKKRVFQKGNKHVLSQWFVKHGFKRTCCSRWRYLTHIRVPETKQMSVRLIVMHEREMMLQSVWGRA